MIERLSNETQDQLTGRVRRPRYDRASLRPRMVHLGVGAFHRAHQAVFTDDANEIAGGDWGTVGISMRSTTAAQQLSPQDGLYTVATRDGEDERYRLIGNILRVITAPEDPDGAMAALTAPDVSIVTLTITEKGYALDLATGELLTEQGDVAHDLRRNAPPRSALGLLSCAINRRLAAGTPPFTLLSCDNLPSNGQRLKSALVQFATRLDPSLGHYVAEEIRCPATMVDRIVPATTDDDLRRAEGAIGLRDDAHVKTEPFMQWVIEDDFAGSHPPWEEAGAMVVPDVSPYETAKLRLLNGPHSAISYLGWLSGKEFVHEVMADPILAGFVEALMDKEITPTVREPEGMPLAAYTEELRARFRNSSLRHRTWQIAMDGSQKLPQRLLDTIRDRIDADQPFERLATAVAAWMVYATGKMPTGEPIDVRDPLAERIRIIGETAGGDPDALLHLYLELRSIFGDDLPRNERFKAALVGPLRNILLKGGRAAADAAV